VVQLFARDIYASLRGWGLIDCEIIEIRREDEDVRNDFNKVDTIRSSSIAYSG
jgi:hypothetical protein